jgi:hypothetical protein
VAIGRTGSSEPTGPLAPARTIRWPHVTLLAVSGIAIVLLAHAAPLTYDEAYNRLVYGNLGISKILRTYNAPNNHLLFTVLQSFIPAGLLAWDPWTIRIIGVASGILMVAALIAVAAARRTTPLLGLFLVIGSPILVTYLFVSRGYTFSAVLLVAAAALPVALARRSQLLAVGLGAAVLALGTWPLPTNVFFAPGWVLAALVLWGVRAAIAGAIVYAAAVALMFGPIAGQLEAQAKVRWNTPQQWWVWVGDVANASSLVPVCLVLVAALAVGAFAREHRDLFRAGFRDAGRGAQFTLLTLALAVSWFASIGIGHAFGLELPFVRTAVPAIWVAVTAVVAALPRGRLAYAGLALLVPSLVLGALLWTRAVRDGNWEQVSKTSRNDVLYGTTPSTIRDLTSVDADYIVCSGYDSWVCQLVGPHLARSGIGIGVANNPEPNVGCALGSRRPPPPFQVLVYRDQTKLLGILCH